MSETSLRPSARRVLDRLRQGPASTHDLCQPDVGGLRFGARLLELREAGMEVSEERLPLPTRGSLYRLLSEPNENPEAAPAEPHGGLFDAGAFHHSDGFGDAA